MEIIATVCVGHYTRSNFGFISLQVIESICTAGHCGELASHLNMKAACCDLYHRANQECTLIPGPF